jgi:hypothetical protein
MCGGAFRVQIGRIRGGYRPSCVRNCDKLHSHSGAVPSGAPWQAARLRHGHIEPFVQKQRQAEEKVRIGQRPSFSETSVRNFASKLPRGRTQHRTRKVRAGPQPRQGQQRP